MFSILRFTTSAMTLCSATMRWLSETDERKICTFWMLNKSHACYLTDICIYGVINVIKRINNAETTRACTHTHWILHILTNTMQMSNLPPLLTCELPPLPHPPSCSESGLQFVPLPYTSLFKMTLLHFMVNQLFCLTQSAGSASQPARSGGEVWWWYSAREKEKEQAIERGEEGD